MTFYSTEMMLIITMMFRFRFLGYDATAYNNANVVEVIEEPVFIDPTSGIIPCFLKDTNILTTRIQKVQNLIQKNKLIDHKNNVIECLEVENTQK